MDSIKITIPYNIFIDLTFSFKQFKALNPNYKELAEMFNPFEKFERHKRKDSKNYIKIIKLEFLW